MRGTSRAWRALAGLRRPTTGLAVLNVIMLGLVIYVQGQLERRAYGMSASCASSFELQKAREVIERKTEAILAELGDAPASGSTIHGRLASVEMEILDVAAELRRISQWGIPER